jgi:hypothetical protein
MNTSRVHLLVEKNFFLMLNEAGERAVVVDNLAVGAVRNDLALGAQLLVLLFVELRESPVLRNNDLLSAGELVAASIECFDGVSLAGVLGSDRNENLTDINACNRAARFPKRSSHTSLEPRYKRVVRILKHFCADDLLPISSGTRKHFVDSEHVVWVHSHPHVETIFAGEFGQVLVGADTSGFQSFGRKLLLFQRNHVNAHREVINVRFLPSQIVNPEFGVGNTTAIAGLDVWPVLEISVAEQM